MDVDGGEGGADAGGDPAAASAFPDAYEFSDPADVLDTLEKAPANKEQPKFWGDTLAEGSKWEGAIGRADAAARARRSSQARVWGLRRRRARHQAGGDEGRQHRVRRRGVRIRGSAGEGLQRNEMLGRGRRLVLPGMLDKLKDKNASVVQKNQDALLEFSRHCFTLADVADDVVAALGHKMPKVRWRRRWRGSPPPPRSPTRPPPPPSTRPSSRPSSSARTMRARRARGGHRALAAVGRAGGGWRSIARHVDALDDARKAKVEEACGAAGKAAPLAAVDVNRPNATSTVAIKPARPATAAAASRIRLIVTNLIATAMGTEAGRRVDEVNGRCRGVVGVRRLLRRGRRSERGRARVQGGGRRAHDCAFWQEDCRAAPIRRLETAIGGVVGVAAEAVRAMSSAEADDAREVVTRGLAVVPGFDDKNFQVLGRVFEILGALADKAAGFSKPDGARVVSARRKRWRT